nr:hypothetical protein [Tanacetum cinerariifolium]
MVLNDSFNYIFGLLIIVVRETRFSAPFAAIIILVIGAENVLQKVILKRAHVVVAKIKDEDDEGANSVKNISVYSFPRLFRINGSIIRLLTS